MSRLTRSTVDPTRIVRSRCRPHLALALCCGLTGLAARVEAQPFPTRAADLLALGPDRLLALLERSRPRPATDAVRQAARRLLPEAGDVRELAPPAAAKIRALAPVLRAANRVAIYDITVADVPQAAAGNHLRAVIVVSKPAVDLLSPDELQAIVAHELAHEYVWDAHEEARAHGDQARLRELELVCDALAVLVLRAAGVDDLALPRAIDKITRFNRRRFGEALDAASHPTVDERRRLVQALAASLQARLP